MSIVRTPKAKKYENIHKKLSIFRKFSLYSYLMLGFFQKPAWCINKKYSVKKIKKKYLNIKF